MSDVPVRDADMSCDEVDAAVAEDERMLAAGTDAPPSQLRFNLARSLHGRYRCQGAAADLDRAVEYLDEAIETIPADAPVRKAVISELASYLAERGGPGDAERADQLSGHVLGSMPGGSLDHGIALAASAETHYLRFTREMNPGLLDEAIRLNELAVDEIPMAHPQGAVIRTNLAVALAMRFQLTKSAADFSRVVQIFEGMRETPSGRAVMARPEFAANLAQLVNMALLFDVDQSWLARLRALAQPAAGAATGPAASAASGQGTRSARAVAGDARASELFLKYQHEGREQDLRDAVRAAREAAQLAPPGMPSLVLRARLNLAMFLYCLYLLRKDPHDLDEAVRLARDAAETAANDLDRGAALIMVGACLMQELRCGSAPGITLVEEAISALERAHGLLGDNALLAPGLASSLADALMARAMLTRDSATADRAIQLFKMARDADAGTSSLGPGTALVLAQALQDRAALSGQPGHCAEADQAARAACADAMLATLPNTFQLAASWGADAWDRNAWAVAGEAYSAALRALYDLARTQVAREQSETTLRTGVDIAARAAYALIHSGSADSDRDAAEILEAGRAVLLSAAVERDRLDLEQLEHQHRDLAADYRAAVTDLNHAEGTAMASGPGGGPALPTGSSGADAVLSHLSRARDRFAQVVTRIQALPGYEQFFRLPDMAAIQAAPQPGGPLVYLAATDRGGVAILVHADGTAQSVKLPDLTTEAIARHVRLLQRMTSGGADGNGFDDLATWMWRSVMSEVLGRVAGASAVTLIPTGLLGLLPLHAAGEPGPDGWRYALDQVAIRYVPNARALASARRVAEGASAVPVMVVANPTGDLRGALREATALREVFAPGDIRELTGTEADRSSVLAAMAGCGTAYFACHGLAAMPPKPALDSHLLVADGDITVRDLLREDLRGMRLAVLSACESARVSTDLPDEVVALPAGLMQAGAAGVVGSLWRVGDRTALQVMRCFAETWYAEGVPPAEALRQAQRWARDEIPECADPLEWAAFTFTGA